MTAPPAIQDMICPPGLGNSPGKPIEGPTHVTVHCTGNHDPGAGAERHALYQLGGSGGSKTSWHYSVDAGGIWRSFEDSRACWHTGTARGNACSIGIEICVHDRAGFPRACENAARLAAWLLEKHRLPPERLVQHHFWSGKDCPAELRSGAWGVGWDDFLRMAAGATASPEAMAPAMAGPEAAEARARLEADVEALRRAGVIESPAYWLRNAPLWPFVPELIGKMAARARP